MKHVSISRAALLALFVLLFVASTPAYASGEATYGQPVYGGGVIEPREGNVMVDKTVQNPASGAFVDHLGPDDPRYRPGQIITFHIKVNNPGNETLDTITVTDTFPMVNNQHVIDFMSGPGQFNADTNTLTFQVTGLEQGQSKEFEVKGKIVHAALLETDQTIICPEPGNVVTAQTGDKTDKDESKFCIEKEPQVTQAPEAGPAQWLATSMAFVAALSSGWYLRRKAVRN